MSSNCSMSPLNARKRATADDETSRKSAFVAQHA
jgi:hypothetical protein